MLRASVIVHTGRLTSHASTIYSGTVFKQLTNLHRIVLVIRSQDRKTKIRMHLFCRPRFHSTAFDDSIFVVFYNADDVELNALLFLGDWEK